MILKNAYGIGFTGRKGLLEGSLYVDASKLFVRIQIIGYRHQIDGEFFYEFFVSHDPERRVFTLIYSIIQQKCWGGCWGLLYLNEKGLRYMI